MEELKENDFKELYQEENQKKDFVNECSIETDLEVLIPDDYITNITERLKIYKELDNISEEKDLDSMAKELRDRFGKIPQPTMDLFDIVRLRKVAKEYAVEKLVLKREKLLLTFTSNEKSDFYSSNKFQDVLMFVQRYPQHCQMKEVNNTLTLTIQNIKTVQKALEVFNTIANKTN
jgi:transcription-repair coupling factor (superfamily II helicase)